MEGVDGKTACASDAHHSLEADLAHQVALEVDAEANHLFRVVLYVVLWIVFDFTAGIFRNTCLKILIALKIEWLRNSLPN